MKKTLFEITLLFLVAIFSVTFPVFGQSHAKTRGAKTTTPVPPPMTMPTPPVPSNIVQINAPFDHVTFDTSKKYFLTVTPNFICVVVLPKPAKQLITGNTARYKIWALEDDSETTKAVVGDAAPQLGQDTLDVARNARIICIKPIKVLEDIPGQKIETNLTIRMVTGEMLTLALVNGENRSESVDRVEFHDYTQEENDRKHRETELEAQRRREQHEREKTERETFARQRLDQLLNLHPTQTAFPFVVESSKTADGVVRAAGVREKEYFLAIVEIERKNKTADFSQPIFTFEGQALAPAFVKPVPATGNNPIIFAGGFIIPQWLTTTTGKEISVSVNFNRKTALLRLEPNASPKDVIPQVAQPVSTPDPLTTQARQISKEPTDRPAPAVSAPPVSLPGPVKQVTVIEAQQRLMQMVETTNHSETTLKFAQNKEVSVGLKWQRFGQFALVVLSIQRKLGASELKLSAPAWTLSAPVTPLSVFQPLPGLFGTRPLVSGFLLQIPDADAAALQVMCSLSFNQNVLQVRAPATVPPVITDDSLQAQVKPEPPPSQPQTLTNEPKDFSGSAKPVAPNEPKTTTSAPPPTSAPVRSNPDNAPSTPVRVSKRRDDRTKANPKAPVGSLRSQLEQFVLSGTRKDKVERYSLEGVVVKIFEVREIGNQFWVSGEMTNTGDQTLSEVEGFIHTEIGGGMGMVASRNIPATETHCERQKLEAGDHGIFGFILPKKASVLVLHFQWKQGNEIRSFEISPRAQRPELEASK